MTSILVTLATLIYRRHHRHQSTDPIHVLRYSRQPDGTYQEETVS